MQDSRLFDDLILRNRYFQNRYFRFFIKLDTTDLGFVLIYEDPAYNLDTVGIVFSLDSRS